MSADGTPDVPGLPAAPAGAALALAAMGAGGTVIGGAVNNMESRVAGTAVAGTAVAGGAVAGTAEALAATTEARLAGMLVALAEFAGFAELAGFAEFAEPAEYGADRVRLSVPNQNSVVSLAGRGCMRMMCGVIDRTISLFSASE